MQSVGTGPGDPPVGAHSVNAKTLVASYEAQVANVPNDDRQIASAALVNLSRTLCEITVTLSQDTREKLRRNPTHERFLRDLDFTAASALRRTFCQADIALGDVK